MDILELKRVVKANIRDGELRLAASDLGSEAVTAVANSFLPDGHLVMGGVTPVNVVESPDEETISVVGPSNSAPFAEMQVEAKFSLLDGQAALFVTATAHDGWSFDSSFPPFEKTLFRQLLFDPSPHLYLASYQVSAEVGPGMSFDGLLQMASAVGKVGFLFGTESQLIRGRIGMQDGIPVTTLEGPRTSEKKVGFFDLPAVTLTVCSNAVYNSFEQKYWADTFVRLDTSLSFSAQGQRHAIPLRADLYTEQSKILLTADLTEAVDAAMGELSALVNGLGLDRLLPSEHFSVADAVRLTDLVVQVDPSSPNKLRFVTIGAQTTKSWPLVQDRNLGKELTIHEVKFLFRLDDPMGTKQLSMSALGDMTLGQDSRLEFSASSDLMFTGGLKAGSSLKVKELYQSFGGSPDTDIPDLEVSDLDFCISAKSGDYSFNAVVDGDLTLRISDFDFGIEEVELRVNHASGGPTDVQLVGRLLIAGVDLEVTVAYHSAGGLAFEGQTGADEPIDFTDLLDQLFGLWGFDLPESVPDISLKDLYVSYDTATKAFACRGQNTIASQIQLGETVHQVDTYLDLQVTHDAAGQGSYAGFLRGQLTIGRAVFDLEWDFGAANVLKGTWDGTGDGSLGFGDLASIHGIDHSLQPPGGLDLALSRAAFEFDLTQSRFLLSADSARFGEAFFMASNANQTWDFVFGIVLDCSAIPGFPELGVLEVKGSSLILSTVRDDRFRVPSLPNVPGPASHSAPTAAPRRTFPAIGTNAMPLSPGVSVAALLDVDQTASGSVVVGKLKDVVAQPEILIQAVIADPISQSSFRAYLSGSLTLVGAGNDKIVLSNVYVQFQLSPLGVLLSGSVLIPVDHVTVEASGALAMTDVEMQAIFDVKAEADGQPAALPFPFGLLGVRLDELAVAIGMVFEPPGVDLGLEGKFNIVGTPIGSDQFTLILELEGEVPNPLYLSTYIDSLSVSDLITAVTGEVPSDVPAVVNAVHAEDLLVYWSESAGIVLPDRTLSQAGFGFSGFVVVGSFRAHARLQVSSITGVSGDAEMSPINWRDVVSITGNGAGVTVLQELVDGQWRTVRTPPLQPTDDVPPRQSREYQIIPPGGPILAFNSKRSPYLDVSLKVSLFNLANLDVEVEVKSDGFTFALKANVGSAVGVDLECTVTKDGFHAHAELDLNIAGDVGPVVILGVDVGTIKLDVALAALLDIVVDSSHFAVKIAGKFWFDDFHLDVPELTISESFSSLEELPGRVLKQIGDFADQIFKEVFDEAGRLLQEAEAEATRIVDGIGEEVDQIRTDAVQEAARIREEAERVYRGVVAETADIEGEAQALEKEAVQILKQAADEVLQIGQDVEREVAAVEAEAKKLLDDAGAAVQEIERVVGQEVGALEAQAKKLLDDAEAEVGRIEEAIGHEVETILNDARDAAAAIVRAAEDLARQMADEAKKILDDIADEAKKAAHWVEKTADDAWHTIKKY